MNRFSHCHKGIILEREGVVGGTVGSSTREGVVGGTVGSSTTKLILIFIFYCMILYYKR